MRRGLLLAAALLVLAAPAQAGLVRLDSSAYPELEVLLVTDRPVSRPPALLENGKPVAGLRAENLANAKSVVLAVDRSRSMVGGSLEHAVAAARAFVAAKPDGDRLAVVGFSSKAQLLSRFSSATIDADIALRTMGIDAFQGTALNDAVVLAARELATERSGARVLVLLTDGADVSSTASEAAALEAARAAGVSVYTIGIEGPQFSPEVLQRLSDETGGAYHGAAGAAAVAGAYAGVAHDLRRTWRLRWLTTARPGEQVELTAGSATLVERLPGAEALSRAPAALGPEQAYTNRFGALAVGAAAGVLVLLAFAAATAAKRGSWVRKRLAPHVEQRRVADPRRPRERFAAGSAVVTATERALGELALWRKAHRLLERADVPLRTGEFFWICLGAGFVVALLVAVTGQPSPVLLAAMALGASVPVLWVWLRAKKRLRAFDNQLPDLLLTMAASLKAGHSFKQGLQTVVDEGLPPASEELQRVLAEVRLGRPMDDALRDMSERVGSKNLDFVITAVTIQGQVGGSLAGLFDMVAEAVRQRQQFARKIRGLTAMGRASAWVLIGIPFGLAALLTLVNGEYMSALWSTSTGHMLVGIGLGMMAVGSLLIKRIVSFKG